MSRVLPAVAAGALCLGLATAISPGQENGIPPEPNIEESRPYVPPPAWKSVEIANYYLKRKKYKAALSRYQEAVAMDPHYAPAYLGLGRVYDKIGLKRKALEAYRTYLDQLPSLREAEEAKDAHDAIARLERQLKITRPATGAPSSALDPSSRPR